MSRRLSAVVAVLALASIVPCARAGDASEYRLKAAFLFNFAVFTTWPADVGPTLTLCIEGDDPFGPELDPLEGRAVGERTMAIRRKARGESLAGCQIVYVAPSAIGTLPRILERLGTSPVLTVADSPGAVRRGVALNMAVSQSRVTFEANVVAAHGAGLVLSSKLLRLATEVVQ